MCPAGAQRVAAMALFGSACNALAQCEPTWLPQPPGSALDKAAIAFVRRTDDLVAGGGFSAAGGAPASGIARWDGAAWHPMGQGIGGISAGSFVSALGVYQGSVVAGGEFTEAGGVPALNIARWDGLTWHPLGAGVGARVRDIEVYRDEMIAAGWFGIARWNGRAWLPIWGGPPNHTVEALARYQGDLVVAGCFSTIGGVIANGAARWNGNSWMGFGITQGGPWCEWATRGLAPWGEQLAAIGHYLDPPTTAMAWTGSSWVPLGTYLPIGILSAIDVYRSEPIIGGSLPSQYPTGGIYRWNGSDWSLLGGGVGPWPATAAAFANFRSELIVGGGFQTAGGLTSPFWARWGCACYGDCDNSGNLTLSDFGCFQNQFVLGHPYVDCNGDDALTIADFSCFQTRFVAGCP